MGRYHSYRLHPLSVGELCGQKLQCVPFQCLDFPRKLDNKPQETLENLLTYGGFPEIYTSKDLTVTRRWHNERLDRIIKEDIRDIELIRDISSMQVLAELLPSKVGSLFSLNSLREDLEVSHQTIAAWVDIFERFYYHFRIYPFQNKRIRSLKKEPKLYLWDWSEINDEDIRFENLIAGHLLKFCHFLYDTEGFRIQLYYLRDKDQREADFLVTVDNKPWFCVEVKNARREVPLSLRYFQERLKIPFAYLVVRESGHDRIKDGIRILSVGKFLSGLI
jgi:predicted AAA+ superfamily ATPase